MMPPMRSAGVGRLAVIFLASFAYTACDCGALPLPDAGDGGAGGAVGGGTGGGGIARAGGGIGGGDTNDGGPDAGCPPFLCLGRCGPIRDFCSGQVFQCGGCDSGFVCNEASNLCTVPEITCQDLGAECGQVRNSCGKRLNCGACSDAGLECDRNTNHCVTCTNPSCADLGYTCGRVWLGCGPFTSLTDCGTCPAGSVCNLAFNGCEPSCTAGSVASLCAASGAQCGLISDGCGGQVDCGGCAAGLSCGARGIGNRCDPPEFPNECITANRNCGPYTSACGGPTLNCGTCTAPNVCVNGQCMPPCSPSTCTTPGYVNHCGMGLDAGCGQTLNCGCGAALNCTAAMPGSLGDCVASSTCATYGATGGTGAACSIGPSPDFSKGDGTNLACPCAPGGVCNAPGTMTLQQPGVKGQCCVNTVVCASNECNTTKTNACTGATITCACTQAGTHCDNSTNTCIPNNGCSAFTNGAAGSACSNGPSAMFPKGDGTNLTCPCSAPGAQCYSNMTVLPNGSSTPGSCCVSDPCPVGSCAPVLDHCTGQMKQCRCGANQFCAAGGACQADLTCADYSATGMTGAICSNGPSFSTGALPDGGAATDGGGVLLSCPCTGQGVCVNGTTVVGGGQRGSCCTNTITCGNTCNTSVMNSCTGAVTQCNCGAGFYCSSTTGPGTCLPDDTCATYMATGAANAPCSSAPDPMFSRFPGDTTGLTCPCTGGRVCSSGGTVVGPGATGACCTNTNLCGNQCNTSVTDSCTGAVTQCNCGAGSFCSSTTGPGTCTGDYTCGTYSATGAPGAPCSTTSITAFARFPGDTTGQTCNCTGGRVCSSGGVTVSAGAEGACCTNAASCGNTCNTSVTNTCTGAAISCTCGAGTHCSSTTGAGTCVADKHCSDYGANGAVGQPCSTVASSAFPGGPAGGNLTCPCNATAPNQNNTCTGSSMTTAGSCSCTPTMPQNCGDNGRPNGCGGTMSSPCASGQVCYMNACCTSPVCPAGNAGDRCGVISACGQSTGNCACTAMYQTCGAVTPGICGCNPKTRADCGVTLPAGMTSPDGCGGFVNCPN
jgi:hypothetical protein